MLLEANHITKRFSGIRALSDVTMEVDAGEIVGLIGPNGAGKTTFFNCLTGMLHPDGGRVVFDGNDVTHWSVHRRARAGFGRTFQRMELFGGMTVRDHVLVAERAHSRRGNLAKDLLFRGRPTAEELARADETLALLGLADDGARPVEALTLGQGRLVELARALMTDPKVLFLDEPSSGLDVQETVEVTDLLLTVQRERRTAILLVEHDIEAVQRITNRLFVLDYGTLIAAGPTDEVLADPRVREAYLGVGT